MLTTDLIRSVLQRLFALEVPNDEYSQRVRGVIEAAFAKHPSRIAAVFIESVQADGPAPGYFDAVGDITQRNGAVFVLDEMKTGFRYALGGAQEHYGIEPDLTAFGKAMSNGYPGSAVVGRRDVFQSVEPYMGATFHGDGLSIAAALETIRRLRHDNGIAHLWHIGGRLKDGLNQIFGSSGSKLRAVGDPPLLRVAPLDPEDPLDSDICSLMHLEGVYILRGAAFTSLAHIDADVDESLAAAERVMARMAS